MPHLEDYSNNFGPGVCGGAKEFVRCVMQLMKAVTFLIDIGASLNPAQRNPLQAAVCQRHIGVVQIPLDNGADVNTQARAGDTAVQFAAQWGQVGVVQMLSDNGADVNALSHRLESGRKLPLE